MINCKKPAFVCNYFRKKSIFSIIFDFVFFVIVALLIYPGTRKDVAAFFIRLTSLPPSTLDAGEQFTLDKSAENWNVYNLSLQPVALKNFEDKPVFINIWATWCPPCIAELPGIMDLYKDYKDKVNFLIISNEQPEKIKSFLEKNNYDHTPFYIYRRLPVVFRTESIPTTFIIDKNKKVILEKKGSARWNSGKIRKLLNGLSER